MRPGRHGGMSSSELEGIISRNGNFLSVRRAGDGDGEAGLYHSVSGAYIAGIGGGWIPEYSTHRILDYGCECNPTGKCRTGLHGRILVRGWRNIVYELVARGVVHTSKQIRRLLGEEAVLRIKNRGLNAMAGYDPDQTDHYASL